MESPLVIVFSERLHNANRKPVFGVLKLVDTLTLAYSLRLLPVEEFFDLGVPDYRCSLVIIQEPLNYISKRRCVDLPLAVLLKSWRIGWVDRFAVFGTGHKYSKLVKIFALRL